MAETIEIFTLKIDMDSAIESTAELADETARLKIVNDSYARSSEASTEEQVKAKAAYDASNKQLKQNQRALTDLTALRGKEIKTVQQGRNALKVMNTEWSKQASLYGANSKQANKLAGETLKLRDRLKELEKGVGDNTRNVGNYAEGFKEALGSNNLFTRSMQNLTQAMKVGAPVVAGIKNEMGAAASQIRNAAAGTETMTRAQKAAAITSNVLSGALKVLKVALISTGIGAIIVALGSLIAFFTNTQRGADAVSKAMAGLGAAFDVILDRLSLLGEGFTKLFSGDISGFFDAAKESVSGLNEELQTEIRLAIELEDVLQKVEKAEINLDIARSAANKTLKELNLIAEDVAKTDQERFDATVKFANIEQSLVKEEVANQEKRVAAMLGYAEVTDEVRNILEKINKDGVSLDQLGLGESTIEDAKAFKDEIVKLNTLQTASFELQTTNNNKLNILQNTIHNKEIKRQKDQLAAAKKITDEALKDSKTRLQIFVEENKGKTETLNEGLIFFEDIMTQQLALELERHEAGKTNAIEYELALLEIKNEALKQQATLTKEFADAEIEAEKTRLEEKKERDQEELEIKKEKDLIEFEAYQETRVAQGVWEFDIIRTDLERQKEIELATAEKVGADTAAIEKKYAAISTNIKREEQNAKLQATADVFGSVAELLGKETAAGKAAAIAQVTIQTYLGAQQAFTSLSSIPVIGPALGAVAAGLAVAAGIKNIQKIVNTPKPEIPKAESGGLFSIGGRRHSSGGTKFYGEDGTRFEAEQGELIGVMNRRAASSFMKYNDDHGPKGTRGNYFADGGIVTRSLLQGSSLAGTSKDSVGIDYDLLAEKIAIANESIPAPIVTVEDINSGQENLATVVDGANV